MSETLTAAEIDELERLEKAATPIFRAPTDYVDENGIRRCTLFHRNMPGVDVVQFRGDNARATADHYIALRNHAPTLLAAAKELEATHEQLRLARADAEAMRKELHHHLVVCNASDTTCLYCERTAGHGAQVNHSPNCVLSPHPGQAIAEEVKQLRERLEKAEGLLRRFAQWDKDCPKGIVNSAAKERELDQMLREAAALASKGGQQK